MGERATEGGSWAKKENGEERRAPESPMREERVNHPPHYGGDVVYEAIKVIEAWGLNFSLGSAVKYICRHGKKAGEHAVEDLRKAAWYLNREADRLEKERAQ